MKNVSFLVFAVSLDIFAVLASSAAPAASLDPRAGGGNAPQGYDMAPETRLEVVEAATASLATPLPPGPYQPTWASLKENYRVPPWCDEAKFGLSIHWGLYAVPAHHNEWYEKHMYGGEMAWHVTHYGPLDKFGYKDFIPLFTAEKFDPEAWAVLFKKSGARFVIPTAQHHDNFPLWDSAVTPINAKQMGPHRDLIGELAKAVRAQGLKFGLANHGIENFQFINPSPALAAELKAKHADLYDPNWADFYHVADRSDAACEKFLVDWYARTVELIDKYQPDILWFDNGIDQRYLDPLKLRVAAYYYNRAHQWDHDVSLSTKKAAYAPSNQNTETIASIIDFEKIGPRSPSGIRTGNWQVHEQIGTPSWGYTEGMTIFSSANIIAKLADTVSKNGALLLNLSPKADGTIPAAQQETLLGVGRWLAINGEAIYGTHNWIKFGGEDEAPKTPAKIRFTVKGDVLYAILIGARANENVALADLSPTAALEGKISAVTLLGSDSTTVFSTNNDGLHVKLPETLPSNEAAVLKIIGLKMNPNSATLSGNPT